MEWSWIMIVLVVMALGVALGLAAQRWASSTQRPF